MKFIGYARVENEKDDLQEQLLILKPYTTDTLFDIDDGKALKGTEINKIMFLLNQHTTLIVPELKTISIDLTNILKFLHIADTKGYNFITIKEKINTKNEDGKFFVKTASELYKNFVQLKEETKAKKN